MYINLILIYFVKTRIMNRTDKQNKVSIFQKVLEDKRAIRECIQKGGNVEKVAKDRGIKFATPV